MAVLWNLLILLSLLLLLFLLLFLLFLSVVMLGNLHIFNSASSSYYLGQYLSKSIIITITILIITTIMTWGGVWAKPTPLSQMCSQLSRFLNSSTLMRIVAIIHHQDDSGNPDHNYDYGDDITWNHICWLIEKEKITSSRLLLFPPETVNSVKTRIIIGKYKTSTNKDIFWCISMLMGTWTEEKIRHCRYKYKYKYKYKWNTKPGQKRRSDTADMREFARGSPSSLSPSPELQIYHNIQILVMQFSEMKYLKFGLKKVFS